MKVAVIGAGSTYTPELVNGFLSHLATFPLDELWLMDIDPERLEIVGGFAQRMVAAKNTPFRVVLTHNRRDALQSATYVITQLRVGKMQARREDEYLGQRHGLIGQETTGVGGMAKALRTIPVILDIAEDMRELSPGGMLVNFTNPAGLVTEALTRHAPDIPSVGVCNTAITTKMHLLEDLEKILGQRIESQRAELDTLGLNHLTWHRGFKVDGEELWGRIFPAYVASLSDEPDPEWDISTLQALGMIPNYYLGYFYYTEQKLKAQTRWPPSRAEQVMQIEAGLLEQYADLARSEPPADLMKRGGAYYSTLAVELLESHYNNLGQVLVVNTRNNGAVPGWPDEWVIEIPCKVDRQGVHPLPGEPLPPVCAGLVAQVKAFELHTVEAAIQGDRQAAHKALLAHPLGPSADRVEVVLTDLLETNKPYLPQFFG